MPLLGLLTLMCRPIRLLIGGAFILGMVCIGLVGVIHEVRTHHHASSAAIERAISANGR